MTLIYNALDSEGLTVTNRKADSSVLSLNRALDEDASIIANFQSIDITTLPSEVMSTS